MKTLSSFRWLIATLLICSCTQNNRTELNISITGSDNTVFLFFPPDRAMPDTINFDPGKELKIEYDYPGVSSVRLLYNGSYTSLLLEPGKVYNISMAFADKKKMELEINDPAIMSYYTLSSNRDMYRYEWIKDYTIPPLDTVGSKLYDNFMKLAIEDLGYIDLLDASYELQAAMRNETELYWLTTISKVIRNNYGQMNRGNAEKMYPGYREMWDKIYTEYPVSAKYRQTVWLYDYAQIYATYYSGLKQNRKFDNYNEYMEFMFGNINSGIIDESARESAFAECLAFECLNNSNNSKEVIKYINDFGQQYPGNVNQAYFRNYLAGLEEFYRVAESPFPDDVLFVDNYENLTTLKDVISKFKGQPVFIDFWFSTCGPCIKEFGHNKGLKNFLKENNIAMLYVSIDRPSVEENWKNRIKNHHLAGYHVRTSQALHEDMHKNYGIYGYPHYMIVGSDGNILLKRTKHNPSDGEKLYEEIRTTLKL